MGTAQDKAYAHDSEQAPQRTKSRGKKPKGEMNKIKIAFSQKTTF
jgi:hypothetical protein